MNKKISFLLFVALLLGAMGFRHREKIITTFFTQPTLELKVESVNDFSQIFFIDKKGERKQLTNVDNGYFNHFQPYGVEDYAVWIEENLDNGVQQIILYQFSNNEKKVINSESQTINQFPKVNEDGQVVWQSWVDGNWQVIFFDGQNLTQITSGDMAISPKFRRQTIEFLRRNNEGEWRSESYAILHKKTRVLKKGEDAKADF